MKTPIFYNDKQMQQAQEQIDEIFGGGQEGLVGHEITSEYVHSDVLVQSDREGNRSFVTMGMGARAMNSPIPGMQRVELAMLATQGVDGCSDEAKTIMCELQHLSKVPFQNNTFFGPGHTVNASEKFTQAFGFDAFLFMPISAMGIEDLGEVIFLLAIPIYEKEREMMIRGNSFEVFAQMQAQFEDEILFADTGRNCLES